jgi:hypothetical protein
MGNKEIINKINGVLSNEEIFASCLKETSYDKKLIL